MPNNPSLKYASKKYWHFNLVVAKTTKTRGILSQYAFSINISLMWELGRAESFKCGIRLHPSHTLLICLTLNSGEDTAMSLTCQKKCNRSCSISIDVTTPYRCSLEIGFYCNLKLRNDEFSTSSIYKLCYSLVISNCSESTSWIFSRQKLQLLTTCSNVLLTSPCHAIRFHYHTREHHSLIDVGNWNTIYS